MLAIIRDDGRSAQEQYALLEHGRGTILRTIVSYYCDHILALLAHTMQQLNQAAEHFEDTLTFCRKADFRPELAWTYCDYVDMLLDQSGEGGRVKDISLLDESLAISSELGMRPLMERVLSRREILRA